MTKEQFKFIWHTKVRANGPWKHAASDPETARMYRDKLTKYDKDVLSRAVDQLLIDESGTPNNPRNFLPPVGTFIEYCQWVKNEGPGPKPKNLCPCCQNTGWIHLKEKDMVVPCDCNNSPGMPSISRQYGDGENKKCESGECSPSGVVFINGKPFTLPECPKGKEHYEKYE